ncbi:hypothetical protein KVT40_003935 [Elsinoe batatas]|uniref:Glycosyltransferase family 25 protein n=1 Tax=Elsinoe batatas TaxID=2601811 RepID=A0A8K0L2Z1_9PEZI|nr:hypothetical protein KVT40_003935 [Elsinoe batatas]
MIARSPPRVLRPVFFFTIFFCFFYILISNRDPSSSYANSSSRAMRHPTAGRMLDIPVLPPANLTLGFGAVAAVSVPTSPRQNELIMAAQITGLQLSIPVQPSWNEEDTKAIKAEKGSTISHGSALAWLGHLNTLRWFLTTNLTTALILEDDVNWDIHLRTLQAPRTAAAMRYLMSQDEKTKEAELKGPIDEDIYWGPTDQWDMLYLGHCGEKFNPGKWNFRVKRAGFEDQSMPRRQDMHGDTRALLNAIDIPEDVRVVHRSIRPLCTFAYAVTRHAAEKLLMEIAPKEREGGTVAFDVRLLEGCRNLGLKCWSVNPELFHHVEGKSEISKVDRKANETSTETVRHKHNGLDRPKSYEEIHTQAPKGEGTRLARARHKLAKARHAAQQRLVDGKVVHAGDMSLDRESNTGEILHKQKVLVKTIPIAGVDSPKAPNIVCGARMSNVQWGDDKTIEYLAEKVGRDGICVRNIAEQQKKDAEEEASRTVKKRRWLKRF